MTHLRNSLSTFTLLLLFVVQASAAADQPVSVLEGTFFESAKFYTVLAVVVLILVGLFVYLFVLDRRLRKLEADVESQPEHR